jgi:CubicO group peptidase (beta-lactamase class C family)
LKIDAKELKALLDEWREKHGVVGAAISVLSEGKIEAAASGSLSLLTNVEATAESAFQIGSISPGVRTRAVLLGCFCFDR